MGKLVVFKIGEGNVEQGFPVTLQIGDDGDRPLVETIGKLPPAFNVYQNYTYWRSAYRSLGLRPRLAAPARQVTNVAPIQDCCNAAQAFYISLNAWLNSESFRSIREKLLEKLVPSDEVRMILQVEDIRLQQLPWHLWDWFERYPKAEMALGASTYERVGHPSSPGANVRVLAILGNSTGINTQIDRALLEQLPDADVNFLVEPQRQDLTDQLWDQSWDILFFAGHSSSQVTGKTGQIDINQGDSLTIHQLKYALKKATERGLKLAIFNSCDGLGLARDLADLNIPQIILMREPVPDQIAQEFLKYFLETFARGKSLYLAVREARERLQGLEDQFPYATWLPVIYQNPAEAPPTWQGLRGGIASKQGSSTNHSLHRLQGSATHLHQDWGEAVDVSVFYGRTTELVTLEQWIVKQHCRLVALLGMGGIGKTVLSLKLARQIQNQFESVIWRSLRNAPPLQGILANLIQFLSDEQETELPGDVDSRVSRLIEYLRNHRCLLILDNAETVLCSSDDVGHYRDGYQDYGEFLRRVGEEHHQSCLVLTSREKPKEFGLLEGETLPVRSLQLTGLKEADGREIFRTKGSFSGSEREWKTIIEHYAGNPLALKMVAAAIYDLFGSSLSQFLEFLQQGTFIFDDIRDLLDRQFDRLSDLEKEIMYWLAIKREPISLTQLSESVLSLASRRKLPGALMSLGHRALIEKGLGNFTLQPVVMEYITERFIEQVCQEITTEETELLLSHTLIEAQAKDYIRETQVRIILEPIVERLSATVRSKKTIEHKLNQLLSQLRERFSALPSYGGGNIINLLLQLQIDLTGYDFSGLAIWQAYLIGVNLQHVNFAHADLSKSVFTAVLNATLSVTFSPDGKLFAIGNADNKVRLWHAADYKELVLCEGHTSWAFSVVFSPDGQTLASASFDQTIKVWNPFTGECLRTFTGHAGWVWSVAFSPDSQIVASGGDDQVIRLWDVQSGECIKTLHGHTGPVRSVAFSPDSQTLVSGGCDQTLRLWDINTGQLINVLQGHTGWVRSVAFSPDAQTLISGSDDKTIRLWDISTGQCLKTLQGHTNCVTSVAYAPSTDPTSSSNGQLVASGGQDCTVRLWDVSTGQCLKTLRGHPTGVWSIAFHPDGQTLVSGSNDSTVKLWNTRTGQPLRTLQGYSAGVKTVAYSPNGQVLASSGDDKTAKLWDIQSGECYRTLQGHYSWIWCVTFSQDSQTLASSGNDGTIRLWNVSTDQPPRILRGHTNLVFSVAFSPVGASLPPGIGQTLASGSNDQTVRLWNVQSGECFKTLPHRGRVWSVAFSPDGQTLASGSDDKTVRLWDIQSGECLKTLQGHTSLVFSVAYGLRPGGCTNSPEDQILASGSDDKTVRLWDVQSGKCLKTLQGHTGMIWSVTFSPDGQILASGSHDQTVKLWDVQSGKCLKTLQGHVSEVWSTAFSPHCSTLASSSQDGTVKLWDIKTGQCIKTLRDKRPYEQMNITNATGLSEAQKDSLKALGAVEFADF